MVFPFSPHSQEMGSSSVMCSMKTSCHWHPNIPSKSSWSWHWTWLYETQMPVFSFQSWCLEGTRIFTGREYHSPKKQGAVKLPENAWHFVPGPKPQPPQGGWVACFLLLTGLLWVTHLPNVPSEWPWFSALLPAHWPSVFNPGELFPFQTHGLRQVLLYFTTPGLSWGTQNL